MPNLSSLEEKALNTLLKNEAKYSKQIQQQLLDALTSIYGEMTKIYDKYAINGELTKAEMTKYNKYSTMEDQILKKLEPALKNNIKTIQKLLPEQFQQSFFQYAWALDNGTGLRLSWGLVNLKSLLAPFDITNPKNIYIQNALKNYSLNAKKNIRSALLNGLSQGKPFASMAKDIKKSVNKIYSDAMVITRTEGMNAINAGQAYSYLQAEEMGIEGGPVWSCTKDDKTRDTHIEMDGATRVQTDEQDGWVLPDGSFTEGPGDNFADHPGDEQLPPEERCNCIPEYAIPIGFNVEKLYKRYYEGDLINIKTSSGLDLSVTPNHPIFTDHGWVAANLINKSSNIICVDFGKEINRSNHNINYSPPIISKIFNLFRIMSIKQRTIGMNNQFHGDGRNSNIDIELLNSHLWNSFESTFYKPLIQGIFSFTNKLQCFLFGFSSLKYIFISTFHSAYSIMGRFRKFLSIFWRSIFHSDKHGFTSVSRDNVIFQQDSSDNLARDIELECKHFFGDSTTVSFDNVIMVKSTAYSGHVYNLQTKSGYYGIYNDNHKMSIVHNCRCNCRFEVKGYSPQLMRTREEGVIPYQNYSDYAKEYHPDWLEE